MELVAILAGLAAGAAYLLGRRAGRLEDPWVLVGDPQAVLVGDSPAAAPALPDLPAASPSVRAADPERALRNWRRLATTARRIRRLRKIWAGLGNHLKQFSHLG